jgi:hypothetical protein
MQKPTRPSRSSSTSARSASKPIDALAQGPFETADAEALDEVLNTVDPEVAEVLVEIYDESALVGLQVAIVVGSVVGLFGDFLAFRLPNERIEDDESADAKVSQIVRNTTLPRVHLKMEDLGKRTTP